MANQVDIMAIDALDPCVYRLSTAMLWPMWVISPSYPTFHTSMQKNCVQVTNGFANVVISAIVIINSVALIWKQLSECNFKSWYRISCGNLTEIGARELHRWLVNISSRHWLVSAANKPLPEPMLTHISVVIWGHTISYCNLNATLYKFTLQNNMFWSTIFTK